MTGLTLSLDDLQLARAAIGCALFLLLCIARIFER